VFSQLLFVSAVVVSVLLLVLLVHLLIALLYITTILVLFLQITALVVLLDIPKFPLEPNTSKHNQLKVNLVNLYTPKTTTVPK